MDVEYVGTEIKNTVLEGFDRAYEIKEAHRNLIKHLMGNKEIYIDIPYKLKEDILVVNKDHEQYYTDNAGRITIFRKDGFTIDFSASKKEFTFRKDLSPLDVLQLALRLTGQDDSVKVIKVQGIDEKTRNINWSHLELYMDRQHLKRIYRVIGKDSEAIIKRDYGNLDKYNDYVFEFHESSFKHRGYGGDGKAKRLWSIYTIKEIKEWKLWDSWYSDSVSAFDIKTLKNMSIVQIKEIVGRWNI